jgi:hypothetical protein
MRIRWTLAAGVVLMALSLLPARSGAAPGPVAGVYSVNEPGRNSLSGLEYSDGEKRR